MGVKSRYPQVPKDEWVPGSKATSYNLYQNKEGEIFLVTAETATCLSHPEYTIPERDGASDLVRILPQGFEITITQQ